MEETHYDIFISYLRKDFAVVNGIKNEIEQRFRCSCWLDVEAIEAGSQFKKTTIDAIKSAKVFLYMISVNSNESEFAMKELAFASKRGKYIIPINIDRCTPSDLFDFDYGHLDIIDYHDSLQRQKLFRDLGKKFDSSNEQATFAIKEDNEAEREARKEAERKDMMEAIEVLGTIKATESSRLSKAPANNPIDN